MPSSLNWKRSLLTLTALLLFAYLVSSLPLFPSTHQSSKMSPSTLQITISPSSPSFTKKTTSTSPSTSTLPLHITITNPSSSTPLSFLKWNSPLDPKASLLGVFHISTTSGQEVTLDTIKFNRKLPPPRDDVVQVEAGGQVEGDVEVEVLSGKLTDGEGYRVWAEGRWMGVWEGVMKEGEVDVGTAEKGGFRSNEVDVSAG